MIPVPETIDVSQRSLLFSSIVDLNREVFDVLVRDQKSAGGRFVLRLGFYPEYLAILDKIRELERELYTSVARAQYHSFGESQTTVVRESYRRSRVIKCALVVNQATGDLAISLSVSALLRSGGGCHRENQGHTSEREKIASTLIKNTGHYVKYGARLRTDKRAASLEEAKV
jgi:hypothetical protein